MEVKTTSPAKTKEIAQKLATTLKGGEVIALFGDLGAGKTVFVQGLAKGLNIKNKPTSPTFVFLKSYQGKVNKKNLELHHFDLYRIESAKDFESLGLDDYFSSDSIVVLEWAQKVIDILPKKRIEVAIKIKNHNERRIEIKTH